MATGSPRIFIVTGSSVQNKYKRYDVTHMKICMFSLSTGKAGCRVGTEGISCFVVESSYTAFMLYS